MRKIGITRDKTQLDSLMQSARKKDIEILPLPVTKIQSLFSDNRQLPNISNYDWLFFSSANGVNIFFQHWNIESLPHAIKVAAVGKKTTEAIVAFGLDVHFQPSEAYGKNLFDEFQTKHKNQSLKILYVRPEKVNYNPDELFNNSLVDYNELILYRSADNSIKLSEIEKLSDNDYILFTAPTTVDSYNSQFGKPKAKLIAIGRTTKDAIEQYNWKIDIVLDKPEIDSVLEYI